MWSGGYVSKNCSLLHASISNSFWWILEKFDEFLSLWSPLPLERIFTQAAFWKNSSSHWLEYSRTLIGCTIFECLSREIRWFVLFGGYERAQKYITKLYGMFLHKTIKDEKLREKLRPNFKLGCKRILISDEYYQRNRLNWMKNHFTGLTISTGCCYLK